MLSATTIQFQPTNCRTAVFQQYIRSSQNRLFYLDTRKGSYLKNPITTAFKYHMRQLVQYLNTDNI